MLSCWKRLRCCTTSGTHAAIATTGFHPLDGARFLRGQEGADDRVVCLVAHHSCALLEAEERGLRGDLEAEFELERPDLVDAMLYCDMTTTPDGTPTTPTDRLDEIVRRYGPDTIVGRFIQRAAPEIHAASTRVEDRLAKVGKRLAEVGLTPRGVQTVPNTQHHRGMDVQPVKIHWGDPADLFRLTARAWGASDRVGPEADGELLPDLSVVVCQHVLRVGVEADDVVHLYVYAGLFLDFTDGGLRDSLANVVASARQSPQIVVRLVDEQQPPCVVSDDDGHGGDDGVGLRGLRVAKIVDSAHQCVPSQSAGEEIGRADSQTFSTLSA